MEQDVVEVTSYKNENFKLNLKAYGSFKMANFSGTLVLWNMCNVHLFQCHNLTENPLTFTAEFSVINTIVSCSHVICLDSNGNVHTVSYESRSLCIKNQIIEFKPRQQGILNLTKISADLCASLQLHGADLFLCTHRLNAEFKLLNKVSMNNLKVYNTALLNFQDSLFLFPVKQSYHSNLKTLVKSNSLPENPILILTSLDSKSLYGAVMSGEKMGSSIDAVPLFVSPIQIQKFYAIEGADIKVILILTTGSLAILSTSRDCVDIKIIHLSSSVYMSLLLKDRSILFSDGNMLWKVEDSSSEVPKIRQLFVRNPSNFVEQDSQIFCLAQSNIMYSFNINDLSVYMDEVDIADNYMKLPKSMDEPRLLIETVLTEISRNSEILKKIESEKNFTTCLALSRRTEFMQKHINITMKLYDSYHQAFEKFPNLILTNYIGDYFQTCNSLILVNVSLSKDFSEKFLRIYSTMQSRMRLYLEFRMTDTSSTITVPLINLSCFNCLIPVKVGNLNHFKVFAYIIAPIPDPYMENIFFWSVIFSKTIYFNSENFVSINQTTSNDSQKEDKCLSNVIKSLFEVLNNHSLNYSMSSEVKRIVSYHIKLSKNYESKLSVLNNYIKHLSEAKAKYFLETFTANNFLKKRQKVYLSVGRNEITLRLSKDTENNDIIIISGNDMRIALDIRNFIAKLVFDGNEEPLVPQTQYTRLENLKLQINHHISEGQLNEENTYDIAEIFFKNMLAALPL